MSTPKFTCGGHPRYGIGYTIGMLQMQRLLGDRKRQLGEDFDLREFHDEFMAAGRLPLSLIRWEMTGLDDEVRHFWKREPMPNSMPGPIPQPTPGPREPLMAELSLRQRRDLALGAGAELFYDRPLEIVRGEGVYLYDKQGRRYVDMYNNVPSVGHGNPAVVRAMAEQQATLNTHSRYLHEGIVAFAERLADLNHDGIESMVYSLQRHRGYRGWRSRLPAWLRAIAACCAPMPRITANTELVAAMSYVGCPEDQSGEIRTFPFPERYRPLVAEASEETLCEAYLNRVESAIDSLEREGHGIAALLVCSIFANEGVPDIPAGFDVAGHGPRATSRRPGHRGRSAIGLRPNRSLVGL